ncbi:hypothetical protein NDU88_001707 [Pleurodeles waltl]|uniref:Integrase catalytic domain-containing protein n=1 Tax=Pleurodeles waltl TaxID=8319 RepID=A0AAV7P801_PLEWA|nr:hypothetical protein NDU88_001707 [Pleurodeles waltl]
MRTSSDNFCRACHTCQASGKTGKRLKALLLPLPVVGTPFERVGIDIVGPLDPKTALSNRFILVLVDHATRYPEAIPLRTVTALVVIRALLGIFTHVGFPKEAVSDRGTNFMSAYMKSMWDECWVTCRFTTPYHPQSNGLVERFNKTLKGMISGLTEAMRRKWDVLLPCLLFAYREVPQKGVWFSPFELLYGHPVRGPLSIVKEGWEKAQKSPPQDVVSYMLALRNQTQRFWKQAQSNLEASQEVMKEWYDRNTTLVEFSPGDKVWVMEPVEPRALQDRWTGPFEIRERKGEATYLVDLKTPRHPLRVLHHNRFKPHFERSESAYCSGVDTGFRGVLGTPACSVARKSLHTDTDRRDAFGPPELRRMASQGQSRPSSRGEIDTTLAVRTKIPRTASRNDVQPENKTKNPRTDPGTSGNPPNHRKRLFTCRKTTHDFPA